MTPIEFIKANPFTAVLAVVILFFLLFFPVLVIVLVVAGFIYERFFIEPTSIKQYPHYDPLDQLNIPYSRPIRGNRLMSTAERNAYLQSPQWKALRQQVIQRDKVCQLSGATDNLEVHHITYDNLGNEYLDDLVLLSRKAHQFIHDYYGSYDRTHTYPITESVKTAYAFHLLNNP